MILGKEELVNALKKDSLYIGKLANDGDSDAQEIMKCYKMWYDCLGDNMLFILCEKAYQKWKSKI